MTFLNPAVLFGLIAAAIPVLLHLLNLRKLKRIEFSTLAFLKELQKNKIRKIKLKQWILLALRVLIILLLVFAFARPTVKGINIGGTTSAAKTTAVFIVDNTFSMSVIDEKGSYFNRAKQVVRSLLDEFQDGDQIALIPVADTAKSYFNITSSPVEFKKNLDELEISNVSGTLNASLMKAAKVLEESQNFNKEIYIFTDLQKDRLWETRKNAGIQEDIDFNMIKTDLSEVFNKRVKLYIFDLASKKPFNLGIDSFEVNNQIFEINKPVSFTASIKNYSDRAVKDFVASLFINGKRSAQQSVSLNSGEARKVTFETILKTAGNIEVICELEDDDILNDNKRYIDISIPEKISVGILSDVQSDERFVKLALSALQQDNNIEITSKNLNQLTSINLDNFDAIFVVGSGNNGHLDRLASYVQNGGGIFLMPGSGSTLESFSSFVKKFNIPVPVSYQGALNNLSPGVNNSAMFDKVEFEHPVFTNLFEKTSKGKIESPEIHKYFKMNSGGKGKSIITLLDRSSFLSEYNMGSGKVLLLNTAPLLDWSDLPLKGIFAPLINKSVYYLASKDGQGKVFKAGDEAVINLHASNFPQLKIERPNHTEEFINPDNGFHNYLNYKNTFLPGNYRVSGGDKLIDYFSVNVDPLESDPGKADESTIENIWLN
jgi:hypothetical protein